MLNRYTWVYFNGIERYERNNDDKIKEKLRETYKEGMTMKEGVKLALDIFKEVQGKKFDISRFELGYISIDDAKLKRIEGDEINKL